MHFLESGTADRQHGLLIVDGEVIPVVLPLTNSGYFEAKVSWKVGSEFERKGYATFGGRA